MTGLATFIPLDEWTDSAGRLFRAGLSPWEFPRDLSAGPVGWDVKVDGRLYEVAAVERTMLGDPMVREGEKISLYLVPTCRDSCVGYFEDNSYRMGRSRDSSMRQDTRERHQARLAHGHTALLLDKPLRIAGSEDEVVADCIECAGRRG